MPTAAFTTLGCKVNQYETQKILESFEGAGFDVVPFDQPADVYVINTCSVTSVAESKSRYTIRRAGRTNPEAKIVVTGCAAQMSLNKDDTMEGADVVVRNPEKLQTLEQFLTAFPAYGSSNRETVKPKAAAGRSRAVVKIQDGCDVLCSYCSIPFTRPEMTSRPWEEVLTEVRALADGGINEVVLTGVLIGAYGSETGSGGPGFEELLEILAKRSGIRRIRISSIEMHQVTDSILDLARDGIVCPHFHIPLQCGDSGVLKDMNRRYDQDAYLALIQKVRGRVPGVMLTTDILVGFPTETEERFQSSLHVVREARYLKAHIFPFSPRWGTPADKWGDPITPPEKKERSARLREAAKETGEREVARMAGQTRPVLAERRGRRDGLLEGTSDNGITVKFAGPDSMLRTIQQVRLAESSGTTAYGELAGRASLAVS